MNEIINLDNMMRKLGARSEQVGLALWINFHQISLYVNVIIIIIIIVFALNLNTNICSQKTMVLEQWIFHFGAQILGKA